MTATSLQIGVIGGSGFIGSRLVDALLQAGHEVRIYDKAPSPTHPQRVTLGDVRDGVALDAFVAGCELLVNLAAEHADDVRPVQLYDEVNVGGARHLVEAARRHRVERILYVSSVAVYGLRQPMADEDAPLRPDSPYGRSKVAAEAVYRQWAARDARHGLLVIRPVVVFGEGNRGNVHTLIEQLQLGRFRMVGNGRNRKSMAYVGNLVDYMLSRLDFGAGTHTRNYADKPDLSTRELVDLLSRLLPESRPPGRSIPYPLALLAGWMLDALAWSCRRRFAISSARIRKFCADTRIACRARQDGFVPRHSLQEGLRRMLEPLRQAHGTPMQGSSQAHQSSDDHHTN